MHRGWNMDRARKTAFALAVALCLTAVLVPLASTAAWAVLLICLASFGINAFAANLIAILTDLFPESILAQVSSLTGVGDGIMSMITMLFTGVVVDRYSYLPVFIAAGLLPLLAFMSLMFLVRKVRPISLSEIYEDRNEKVLC
jgi:ACS family hexuronate transporter-like MFS transporter